MEKFYNCAFYCTTIAYHVGLNAFTGSREAPQPISKEKRALYLTVASGCRHVICPFCYKFSHWLPPFYSLWEVFTAVF